MPSERLPKVEGEVPVAIIFLEPVTDIQQERQLQLEAIQRMGARRAKMAPLGIPIKDLIEEGRDS
jgi:hypothetical protein